jgi:hypothetical protein
MMYGQIRKSKHWPRSLAFVQHTWLGLAASKKSTQGGDFVAT